MVQSSIFLRSDRFASTPETPGGTRLHLDDHDFARALSTDQIDLTFIAPPVPLDDDETTICEIALCYRLTKNPQQFRFFIKRHGGILDGSLMSSEQIPVNLWEKEGCESVL
jgi:hypothetical protein